MYIFVSAFVRANQVRLIAEASSFQLNSASLEQEATHVLCGSVAFSLRTARTCCHSVLTMFQAGGLHFLPIESVSIGELCVLVTDIR